MDFIGSWVDDYYNGVVSYELVGNRMHDGLSAMTHPS
jgi:hypothetical protein